MCHIPGGMCLWTNIHQRNKIRTATGRTWEYLQRFYIGKTKYNVELRWEEHENTSKDSEPAKHLKENLCQKFSWKILFAAPENKQIRKILEASEIASKDQI